LLIIFLFLFTLDSGQSASLGNTRKDDTFEDEELQVQDAIANSSKKTNHGSSPSVVHSEPATLPVPPIQQIPPAQQQETKLPPVQQIPPIPEAKQAGNSSSSFIFLW
jgi:protein O-mannose beta-1,4-N-acetylglucosaminyltransferase